MKRILSFILAIVVALVFSACGNKPQKSSDKLSTDPKGDTAIIEEEKTSKAIIDLKTTTVDQLDNIIVDQSNRHSLNAFCYDSSWIYGPWGGESGKGESNSFKVSWSSSVRTTFDHKSFNIVG